MNEAGADPLGVLDRWREEAETLRPRLVRSIRDEVATLGYPRVALGLSGGLDSAVVAALCVEALGADNVLAVVMPMRTTDPAGVSLAQGTINQLGLTSRRVNMSPVLDAYFANFPDASRNRRGPALGWARIGALLDLGAHYGACVVQALNRSDRLLAYGEAVHELATAVKPLAGLYKSQVQMLGEKLPLLPEVRRRRPSLEYWPGQSDEGDLGQPYSSIDPLLEALVDRGCTPAQAGERGFSPALLQWAEKRVVRLRAPASAPAPVGETRPSA
jgi:NAD+ synthase